MWYCIYKFAGANLRTPIDIKMRKLLKVFHLLGVQQIPGGSKHPKYINTHTGQIIAMPINHTDSIHGVEIEDALSKISISKEKFRQTYWSI